MGSYMGAEVCDLINHDFLFYLNSVNSLSSFGLYCDDELAALNRSRCKNEKAMKQIRILFTSHGFKTSVECNLIQRDFFDINMNLCSNTFATYKKKTLM